MEPAIVTGITAIIVMFGTHWFNNRREAKIKLREERQKTYATMARTTKNMDVPDPLDISDLYRRTRRNRNADGRPPGSGGRTEVNTRSFHGDGKKE